ncbi:hypothetical protein HY230_00885 [Candidatus Acetothermia bacterium]|nr:hypothetical protein [Candidatus Acetothermia bacterium]
MPKRELNLENTLQLFVSQLEQLYGEELISVTLYGSTAGVDYNPERSDLNFLVILKNPDPAQLQKSVSLVRGWQQRRIATPLFLDPSLLESSLTLFPMEFLEMKDQHETLHGPDPLATLEVPAKYLKLQCEQELKGKQLRLSTAYLEAQGQQPALEELLIASVKSFGVIMRTLLRLKGLEPPREFLEILTEIERVFHLQPDGFREAHQLRMGFRRFDRDEAETLFRRIVQDVTVLGEQAEALFQE